VKKKKKKKNTIRPFDRPKGLNRLFLKKYQENKTRVFMIFSPASTKEYKTIFF